MRSFVILGSSVAIALAACSSTSTGTSSGDDAGATSSSSSSSSSGGSSGASSSGSSGTPAPSTNAVEAEIDATCPSFTACGGTLEGTYDYTAFCAGDLFADFRKQCPGLDTSAAKATIKGSIYFLANSALQRNVTVDVSGSVSFPSSCAGGSCAAAEAALKQGFPTSTCTVAGANCTCTVSKSETNTQATTFTVTDNTVTTADGDEYDFCEQGGKLTYEGKTSQSEDGVGELQKR
jgi:hypothetical protein